MKQKRYAATIHDKQYVRVGWRRGLMARIRVVNLDQLKVDPKHQGHTIQVILLKLPFRYNAPVDSAYYGKMAGHSVMIIGYVNATSTFPALQKDYYRLIKLIAFKRWPKS